MGAHVADTKPGNVLVFLLLYKQKQQMKSLLHNLSSSRRNPEFNSTLILCQIRGEKEASRERESIKHGLLQWGTHRVTRTIPGKGT